MGRTRLFFCAITAAAALAACAPKAPNPTELVRDVAKTYRESKVFWVEADMNAEQTQQGQTQKIKATLQHAADTLGHLVVKMNAETAAAWLVANGPDLWVYQAQMGQQQYAQLASAETDSTMRREMLDRLLQAQFPALPVARYRDAESLADSARIEREEKLQIGDREVDCYVVRTIAPSPGIAGMPATPITLWVDKARHVVWKEVREATMTDPQAGTRSIKEEISYRQVRMNEALPDSLFAFTPPPGATQIPVTPPTAGGAPPPSR